MSVQPAVPVPAAAIAATSATPPIPYMAAPLGYPASFFGQYPAMATGKPGEAPTYAYPQYYLAPIPMPPPQGQDGEAAAYPQGLIPATFLTPYAQQGYPGAALPYMLPMHAPRPDGQQQISMVGPPMQYAAYPPQYAKPASRENGNEMAPQMMDSGRRDPRVDQYNARMGDGIASAHGKSG